jgi:carbon-monoxide dehydrogenase medium subunit
MRLRRFEYHEASSVDEAVELAGRWGDGARLLAGGTALLLMIRYGLVRPAHVVSLDRIDAMRAIQVDGDRLRIGALVTHAELASSPAIREHAPLLADAARRVATTAIRNMGTIGGNLCYAESASDPAPALLALEARVVVQGRGGRRTMPLADGFYRGFYETALAEGEVLVEVEVPLSRGLGTYVKWSPRSAEDKALVGVAVHLEASDGICRTLRLGLGGVNATPIRVPGAEAAARGARLGEPLERAVARAAAAEVDPISDVQGSAEYRRRMVEVWVGRAIADVCGRIAAA